MNILQNLVFMYKVKNNTIPSIFQNRFMLNNKHKYTTRSSAENYKKPIKNTKFSQFSISFRGPHLWNQITSDESKHTTSLFHFKKLIKKSLLSSENEENYFS